MKKLIEWMVKRWLPGYFLMDNSLGTLVTYIHDEWPMFHLSRNPIRKAKEGKE